MDIKSAGIVGACIVVAALIIGLLPGGRTSAESVAPSENGRYQFVKASDNNVFVIDTRTGRTWQRFVEATAGPREWTEEKAPWRGKVGK